MNRFKLERAAMKWQGRALESEIRDSVTVQVVVGESEDERAEMLRVRTCRWRLDGENGGAKVKLATTSPT
jgi:hypothetical protein